jgi:D-amino-acid dehydrogenase
VTVIVLGAGAVGLCTALSLVARGETVRLIDRGDPGQETSYGNAGVISPAAIMPNGAPGILRALPHLMFGRYRALSVRARYWPRMIPWGLRFLRESRPERVRHASDAMDLLCSPCIELYRQHLDGTGQEHLVQDCAYIHAVRDPKDASLNALSMRLRAEKGAQLELVDGAELRRIEPALSSAFKAAVVIHDQARALAPGKIMAALAQKAEKQGIAIERCAIERLERCETGWRVICGGQSFEAARVVVAMGAWSPEILKPLGINVPLLTERGYHVEFAQAGARLNNSIMDVDAHAVLSSMEDGLRMAGQAEFGPNDAPPDPRKRDHMIRMAREAVPALREVEPRFWMGRRPSFPDSIPMIGEFAQAKGLYAAFGHSHHGLMQAPKTGEVVADLVMGRRVNTDLSAFATDRFG